MPTPHKTFESSIPEMLPLAAEFDPLKDGGLVSELSTHKDCAGPATLNLSSGEGDTQQSCQTGKFSYSKPLFGDRGWKAYVVF